MTTHADIEQLSKWLAATDISTLELREPGGTLRLERQGAQVNVKTSVANDDVASTNRTVTIIADTPGIFLHAHPLVMRSLVEVGGEVRQGQMVGLIRVGAVLLPVRASHSGRIGGYWAESGVAVEYGTPLIELQVSEASS